MGYPDITLFPAIAEVLGIPIDELFHDKGRVRGEYDFPQYYEEMPFVFSKGNKACYSSKEVSEIDERGGVIRFADGSEADITDNRVYNRGQGEIRFFALAEAEPIYDTSSMTTEIDEKLERFSSIDISNGFAADLKIISVDVGEPRIVARGSAMFISLLKYRVSNGRLWVEWRRDTNTFGGKNNAVEIYVDFEKGIDLKCHINGSGKCEIAPSFESITAKINGSGAIFGADCGKLKGDINGNGEIVFKNVECNAELAINGSGDIIIASANTVSAKINGSGDIETGRNKDATLRLVGSGNIKTNMAGGDFNAKTVGSGNIVVSGEAETFYCGLQGDASVLDGKELTVNYADIHSKGEAHIYLKAIKKESIEKVRPGGMLVVGKRGE